MSRAWDSVQRSLDDADDDKLEAAIWAGDVDLLHELAPCGCCCAEHTHVGCPARRWGGCRGGDSPEDDQESWARHYEQHHGMSRDQFFGG